MSSRSAVKIGTLTLKNPVMVASGTFGYAEEFKGFLDLRRLGAVVTKTVTLHARRGNPAPRTCETPAGMLNSIGLENPGLEDFIARKLPFLKKTGVPVIMSIAAERSVDEFLTMVERLNAIPEVSAIELNISCPNVKSDAAGNTIQSARLVSQDANATYDVVKAVRGVTDKVLITKLSPNVTDIGRIALAAESAGSDAVALINTLGGLCVDIRTRRPKVASGSGGLSGPAIRPVAVGMVWEAYKKIKIPIIGMGGIMDSASALEFIIAGATAVSVGTANFINPRATVDIIDGLNRYLSENSIARMSELTGTLQV